MQAQPSALSLLDVPADDLLRCHEVLGRDAWRAMTGQHLFITGATGYVGKWLLATLLDADHAFGLGCRITALSRDPDAFLAQWPTLRKRVTWVRGDVRDFALNDARFDTIIHAATDVVARASPQDVFSTCVEGTQRVLDLARRSHATRLLLISSGAVYGPLPEGMTHVPETYLGGPDPLLPSSAYGEGKRASEWLAAQAGGDTLEVKIARVFALVGPHLLLDKHFAIGNFLRSVMAGEEIVIQGDGTPHRSYLYAADMAAWLWAVLVRGQVNRAYNVGGSESLSIAALADRVCSVLGRAARITVKQTARLGVAAVHYAPDIGRSRQELHLPEPLPLDEALARTARWHQASHRSIIDPK